MRSYLELSPRAAQIRAECAHEARDRTERLAVARILSTANFLPAEGQAARELRPAVVRRPDWPRGSCFYCGVNSAVGCRHQRNLA